MPIIVDIDHMLTRRDMAVGALRPGSAAFTILLQGNYMRVLVMNHVSLDGVLQAPGWLDEDTRDGFRHGGWAAQQANDPAMGTAMGERMGQDFSWLFGRRSYDEMLAHWNQAGGPFKDGLNQTRKYIASASSDADLPWPNSTLLSGDVHAEVAALPLIPGSGHRLFGLDDEAHRLRLVDCTPTTTGVLMATYQPATD